MAKERIGYIDQFRGLATIFMVETHVVNALLRDSLRGSFIFGTLDFINGFVAPSFLFVAGFSFTLALNRKGDAYRSFSPELWKHLKRLVFIWATGYLMHIPYFSLLKTVHGSTPEDMTAFFAIDILQCIAATLILVHLIRTIVKSDRTFNIILWGLFWLFILVAPVFGIFDPYQATHEFIGQYFNRLHGSLFPLFPWSSFLIAGIISSQKITFEKVVDAKSGKRRFGQRLPLIGGILITAGILLVLVHKTFLPQINLYDYAPGWFLLRLGVLLWILSAIIWYETKRNHGWSSVKIFGRESFLVYVAHILFVYGSSMRNISLVESVGETLNYLQCFGVFAGLTMAMFLLAYAWSTLKKRNYDLSRLVQYAFVASFFYLFIKNSY
ncbi:MAG TPA: heparan-alpha-glucosaminide N-acetyltransferase domain-containing protein [Candidatus Acidoferrales bacterium]|nr:heparan-alpha-glucosaminide N-acetyltransferase domain-containing protein [Candidatus Acidoferrales bacterium]